MKKTWKRLLGALVAGCMMLSMLPAAAFADAAPQDITSTGLDLSAEMPAEVTAYTAGEGTVVFTPADGAEPATLTLKNATITTTGRSAIVAPEGKLNIVVPDGTESTLTTTGIETYGVELTSDTTNVSISGGGTLNINAEGYGITDNDENGSLSIKGTMVNFKCADTAIYMCNDVRIEDADIHIVGVDDPYGIEVFEGGLYISNSKMNISDVKYSITVGRNEDYRNPFEVVDGSEVTIDNASCSLSATALIRNSTFKMTGGNFVRDGATVIEDSTFIVDSSATKAYAFDAYSGGLTVIGNSYVELTGRKKGLSLMYTDETLTLGGGLAVIEGEMDENNQCSTTTRLVIGSAGHNVTVHDGTAMVNGEVVEKAAAGDVVTIKADTIEGMVFDHWDVTAPEELNLNTSIVQADFVMPDCDVEIYAQYSTTGGESFDFDFGTAATIALGGAAVGAAVWQGYELGTAMYLKANLPAGIIIPSNRQELALLVWQRAGEPEPVSAELYSDIDEEDADAQKAARWMVEQGLMKVDEDEPDEFSPLKAVSKIRVCMTWQKAKNMGLFKD